MGRVPLGWGPRNAYVGLRSCSRVHACGGQACQQEALPRTPIAGLQSATPSPSTGWAIMGPSGRGGRWRLGERAGSAACVPP